MLLVDSWTSIVGCAGNKQQLSSRSTLLRLRLQDWQGVHTAAQSHSCCAVQVLQEDAPRSMAAFGKLRICHVCLTKLPNFAIWPICSCSKNGARQVCLAWLNSPIACHLASCLLILDCRSDCWTSEWGSDMHCFFVKHVSISCINQCFVISLF